MAADLTDSEQIHTNQDAIPKRTRWRKLVSILTLSMVLGSVLIASQLATETKEADAVSSWYNPCAAPNPWNQYSGQWNTGDWLSGVSLAAPVLSWEHLGATYQNRYHYHADTCSPGYAHTTKYQKRWSRYNVCVTAGWGPLSVASKCWTKKEYLGEKYITYYHQRLWWFSS